MGTEREGSDDNIVFIVYEPKGVLTTTWEGKFPLYFSESNVSWDVISA